MKYDVKKKVRATTGAVIVKDGKVLLIKRGHEPFKDYWAIPGGHIDYGETAEQAIIREIKEETGLTFCPAFIGYVDELYPDINWHGEVLLFKGTVTGQEMIDNEEIVGIGWFDIDEAIKMKLAFNHEKSLEKYKEEETKCQKKK